MNEDLIREKMETMDINMVVSVHLTMNYVGSKFLAYFQLTKRMKAPIVE